MPKWLKFTLIGLGIVLVGIIIQFLPLIIMVFNSMNAKIEVFEDAAFYEKHLANADKDGKNKWHKWNVDDTIWPRKITDSMNVLGYKMVYYDPWDAQYLGYLDVEYTPEAYSDEIDRLKAYASNAYEGIYSVTEETTHELLAIHADPYYGFVYALEGGENRIIYAQEIFCNYMLDLDYTKYIPADYLLDGFDAKENNPYRKQMMNEK